VQLDTKSDPGQGIRKFHYPVSVSPTSLWVHLWLVIVKSPGGLSRGNQEVLPTARLSPENSKNDIIVLWSGRGVKEPPRRAGDRKWSGIKLQNVLSGTRKGRKKAVGEDPLLRAPIENLRAKDFIQRG